MANNKERAPEPVWSVYMRPKTGKFTWFDFFIVENSTVPGTKESTIVWRLHLTYNGNRWGWTCPWELLAKKSYPQIEEIRKGIVRFESLFPGITSNFEDMVEVRVRGVLKSPRYANGAWVVKRPENHKTAKGVR